MIFLKCSASATGISVMILLLIDLSAKTSCKRNGYSIEMSKITTFVSFVWYNILLKMLDTRLLFPPPVNEKTPKWYLASRSYFDLESYVGIGSRISPRKSLRSVAILFQSNRLEAFICTNGCT